ncbi:MAG: hypothetical protein HZC22_13530 [Rhodocyclales bacterium]|nr:hypothetical protein [Rhodocyclales bacterium]
MLLLIGVWIFFMSRSRGSLQKQSDYMDQVRTYVTEHIAETKRMNQTLERIAIALERKSGQQ